ncbi:hypothetical protein DL98DRAFT_560829 [Cadophora sp. DSE1049]|nr:hypothetical protein DL98DRAFT_560829 [Cadophora sp. DSE1049]
MPGKVSIVAALVGAVVVSAQATNITCDTSLLNTTSSTYYVASANKTVYDIAIEVNRGICDIGRANLMVDVSVIPNVGQTFIIPGEVCSPDWTSCIIDGPGTNDCLMGGPRLYYTLNGDTMWKIAGRLNMTLESINSGVEVGANDTLSAGQFVKVPLCFPSACDIEPYSFTAGVYKDLADEYGSTVAQIQMLSPTYNYSSYALDGRSPPSISLAKNCRLLASNYTILS